MSQRLCLTRQCLGINTRIELAVHPLAGDGLWSLICAAGLDGNQPSEVKAQGPLRGGREAGQVLDTVVQNLMQMGYNLSEETPIWALHVQGELRRQRQLRGAASSTMRSQPSP